MENKKNIRLNIIFSLILQIFEIISTLIVPRLILKAFGSEVNGLVSSLNQFLNYVSLLEGGVASVMMANLYKPLLENDEEKLSSLFATMQHFFRRLSLIFVIFAFGVAGIYPLVIKTSFSWGYIFSLTLILALTIFIRYVFSMSYKLILNADNKIYITAIIQIIVVVLNVLSVYLIITFFPNIHVVKLVGSVVLLVQPFGYWLMVRKHYNINKKAQKDESTLKQRWNGFAINIAHFIHENTDIVVLTIFSTLSFVSVYSVYLLVCQGIKAIVGSVVASLVPSLGKKIAANDKEELNKFFDVYEFFSISITFLAYALGWILVVPFISLYTSGVTDADYIQPIFATVLMAAELVYSLRDPYLLFEYSANHFKQISKYAFIEAAINIVISIPAVIFLGLVGVAIGTLVAMIYRAVATIIYMNKNLLDRGYFKIIKYTIIYLSMTVGAFFIVKYLIPIDAYTIGGFFLVALITVGILLVLYTILSLIFNRDILFRSIRFFLRKERGDNHESASNGC